MQARAKFVQWAGGRRRGVAITGASGWIGRAVVHAALAAPELAALRLFGSRPGAVEVAGRSLPVEALETASPLDPDLEWIVLHLAIVGPDREPDPAALQAANARLLGHARRLAASAPVRRLVFASSGAVRQTYAGAERQAYAALKRDQEAEVRGFAERAGLPLLTTRIFNVGGPYMNHPGRYALGDMILQAARTGVIRIAAPRPVLRSYVHGLELASVMLHLALDPGDQLTLETEGDRTVEMEQLAEAVAGLLPAVIERAPVRSTEEDRYVGDGALYRAALADMGLEQAGLDGIVRDTARWLLEGVPGPA